MRPLSDLDVIPCGVITWTTAPQPESASLSTDARRHCEIVSKSSSGAMSGRHMDSHMPLRFGVHVPDTT